MPPDLQAPPVGEALDAEPRGRKPGFRLKRVKTPKRKTPHKRKPQTVKKDADAAIEATGALLSPPPELPVHLAPSPAAVALWRFRRAHNDNRGKRFSNAEEMIRACEDYFLWVAENPLTETKTVLFQGEPVELKTPKVRMMSNQALCLHLSITPDTWKKYREMDGYKDIIRHVDSIIYTQKIECAAADLLNSNIIVRDLGLKDRTDVTTGGEKITQVTRKIMPAGKEN